MPSNTCHSRLVLPRHRLNRCRSIPRPKMVTIRHAPAGLHHSQHQPPQIYLPCLLSCKCGHHPNRSKSCHTIQPIPHQPGRPAHEGPNVDEQMSRVDWHQLNEAGHFVVCIIYTIYRVPPYHSFLNAVVFVLATPRDHFAESKAQGKPTKCTVRQNLVKGPHENRWPCS
jgi:hypothetical protein